MIQILIQSFFFTKSSAGIVERVMSWVGRQRGGSASLMLPVLLEKMLQEAVLCQRVVLAAGVMFNVAWSSKVLAFFSSRGFWIKLSQPENMSNLPRNPRRAVPSGDAQLEFIYKGNNSRISACSSQYEAFSFQYMSVYIRSLFRIAISLCIYIFKVHSLCKYVLRTSLQVSDFTFLQCTQSPLILFEIIWIQNYFSWSSALALGNAGRYPGSRLLLTRYL